MTSYVSNVIIVLMDETAPDTGAAKYRDKRTRRFAAGERVKEFDAFKDQAERRLDVLDAAANRNDLVKLPSNRFEALGGGRRWAVQHPH